MADERASLEELELRIKEEELKLKQTEIRVKERDLATSKWSSPLVLAILGATVGLLTSVIVSYSNSSAAEHTERVRAQSTLILEAVRGNNKDTTCENLVFFVNLGLLDDAQSTIRTACPSTKGGVPSFPAAANPINDPLYATIGDIWIAVEDADSHLPIEKAEVEMRSQLLSSNPLGSAETDARGYVRFPYSLGNSLSNVEIVVTKAGYETLTTKQEGGGMSWPPTPQRISLHPVKQPSPPHKP